MCIFLLFPSEIYKGCNSFQIHTTQIDHAEILRQSFSLLLALKERNETKCQYILRVDGIFSKMMLLVVLVYQQTIKSVYLVLMWKLLHLVADSADNKVAFPVVLVLPCAYLALDIQDELQLGGLLSLDFVQ